MTALIITILLYIKTLITRFWFITIPLVLYIFWNIYKKTNNCHKNKNLPFHKTLFFKIFIVIAFLALISSFVYVSFSLSEKNESYISNQIVNGHLVPSKVIKKDDSKEIK